MTDQVGMDGRTRRRVPGPTPEMVRFARGLRHELGNILTPVVAFGELLADDPSLSEDARGDVRAINAAAARGGLLVERLLTAAGLAKVEHTQLSVLDLAEAVEESWPEGELRCKVSLATERGSRRATNQADLVVSADTRLLGQALAELADNSLRAGARVAAISVGVEGEECVVRVDDDGSGLTPEELEGAADPYVSSQHSSARGLGLSVVNGIARALGGELVLESAAGAGLAVELRWPAFGVDEVVEVTPELEAQVELDETARVAG